MIKSYTILYEQYKNLYIIGKKYEKSAKIFLEKKIK